jgi:8-oxo-dGTP diphosphatase
MSSQPQKDPLVGVGVFVTYRHTTTNQLYILVGQRAGSHGAGTWQIPGGHLDMFESFETCAQRETKEETNLDLRLEDIRVVTATNNIMWEEKKHYITVFVRCQVSPEAVKQVKVMEPHKLQGEWQWVTVQELIDLKPLFSPLKAFIEEQDLDFLK